MPERTLPKGIYRSGDRFVCQGRKNSRLCHVGRFRTVEEAMAALATWREQNPKPQPPIDESWEVPPAQRPVARELRYPKGYEEAEFQQALRFWLKASGCTDT